MPTHNNQKIMKNKKPKVNINLDAVRDSLSPDDKILKASDCNHIHFGGNHTVVTPDRLKKDISENT